MTDAHLAELRQLARLAVATRTGLALSPHVLAGLIDYIDALSREAGRLHELIAAYNQAELGSDEEAAALLAIEGEGTGEEIPA